MTARLTTGETTMDDSSRSTNSTVTHRALGVPMTSSGNVAVASLPATSTAAITLSPPVQGALWGGAAVTIWGVYLAFARAGVNLGVQPADFAFVRYSVAGLIMLPWLLRNAATTRSGVGWRRASILALLAGPLFILIGASGFKFAPLSHGSIIQPGVMTIAGLLLSAVLLHDGMTWQRRIGAAVILAGLALVAGPGALEGGWRALEGDALFALGGAMWAAFAALSRRWSVSPIAATAVISVLSAAVFAPIYLANHGLTALLALPVRGVVQLILVHGVLSGVIAVFAFGRAVELLGASRAAVFPALTPLVATLAGIPIAGEIPAALQIEGLVLVTIGLFVTQRGPVRRG